MILPIRFHCGPHYLWRMPEMVAPRALVFRPLVKGNEDSGNEIVRALVFGMHFLDLNNKEIHQQQGSKMREGVKMYPENTAYFIIPYD